MLQEICVERALKASRVKENSTGIKISHIIGAGDFERRKEAKNSIGGRNSFKRSGSFYDTGKSASDRRRNFSCLQQETDVHI